ncbi:PQQ-dependent dehydrogenase, methanol/ethanol family [Sphingobium nicotianae]|uniref:PQQ-dependent dehydrogenase, methanol/ethanol family n=1 Tax=Sphingobium nicotianae TaxID=2782607 RepID=A0A9X1DDX4_9SPHN|nr:PQQ-dependent dehydrogenase, methanol/ethanol family [Sphingobium nicotianae]MBT2188109.1 PQQ-dependent dehydrogenase, methanol/ethanol family [Sphingobium nicotianae]
MTRLWGALCLLALAGCSGQGSGGSGIGPLAADNWVTPGGDVGKSHYSTLTDINRETVGKLGLAWSADLGTNRGLEATPVVIDGVMYTSGVAGRVYAFEAATGKALWAFEPQVDMQVNRTVCCDMVNRGVAVARGKVYVTALDGWMYALDQKSGAVVWKADTVVDRRKGDSSTGAPEVASDVVIIGNAGAEYDTRGCVSAFDLETGELKWRFFTVPRDPKLGPQESPDLDAALKTWDPNSRWDVGGGGTPWDAINYDPETGLVLVGTGNGGPYAVSKGSPKGGDNLYIGSIVALDAKTGRLKWHYQETPGDNWDFTSTQPMILTRLKVDGEERPVILHAPKNGFLYVLDRRDGKLLRANALVRMNWANGVDMKTGRPRLTPEHSDYTSGPKIVFPSSPGARNWHPAAYDPQSGLYIGTVQDLGNAIYMTPGQKPHARKALNNDASLLFTSDLQAVLPTLPPPLRDAIAARPEMAWVKQNPGSTELRAIDPLTGRTVWARKMAGWQDRGGALATAGGLVFQGGVDGHFRAFDKKTGKLLKDIATGSSILAAPMTYRVDGIQYVAVMAAWGGGGYPYVPPYSAAYKRGNQGRLLVFKLGGGAVPLPPALPPLEVAPEAPKQAAGVTPATIAQGMGIFFGNCGLCHSNQPRSITPDLRRMSEGTHVAFKQIVLGGLLTPNGMPLWDDRLSEKEVEAVHAYLIDLQAKTRAEELEKQKRGLPLDTPGLTILSNY